MDTLRIGIAGYMGAGKSTCVKFMVSSDTLFISGDEQAKALMMRDEGIRDDLFKQFGDAIRDNGTINFGKLGRIAFSSLSELLKLNSIVHPRLIQYLKGMVLNEAGQHQAKRIVLDAALISLWNIEDWFDRLFWIDSTHEERLDRLCRKYQGKIDCTELDRRMRMQEDLFKPPVSDRWFFIRNQGDINSMEKLIKQLTFGN